MFASVKSIITIKRKIQHFFVITYLCFSFNRIYHINATLDSYKMNFVKIKFLTYFVLSSIICTLYIVKII